MRIAQELNVLWEGLKAAIDRGTNGRGNPLGHVLTDYSSFKDYRDLNRLLAETMQSERGHRQYVGSSYPLGVKAGAQILLLSKVAEGAGMESIPEGWQWMVYRRDAVEAETLGFILKGILAPMWLESAGKLDYAELMNPREVSA